MGDGNSTVLTTIGQKTNLRCLAGGYPKPFVTWWRGDKILPLKDDRIEITRDYSLTLNKVEIYDLGPYVCQAYNSIGRPVSIQVTLKARGPFQARTEEDRKYSQYIEHDFNVIASTSRPQTIPTTILPSRTRPPPHYVPPIYNGSVARPEFGKSCFFSFFYLS